MSQVNGDKAIWVSELTDYHTTDKEGIGNVRRDSQGNRYRYVKNSTGSTLAAGYSVYHGTANTLGYLAEVFKVGQSAKGTGLNTWAGIALSAIPDGSYGWIQTHGYNATVLVESTTDITALDNLKPVTAQFYLVKDTTSTAAPTVTLCAMALAARTTDDAGNIACELRRGS